MPPPAAAAALVSDPLIALDSAPADRPAVSFPDGSLTYGELRTAAQALAPRLAGFGRVAVWATPRRDTCVSVCATLLAGVPLVPLNPSAGERDLAHVLTDSEPGIVLASPDDDVPAVVRERVVAPPAVPTPDPLAGGEAHEAGLIIYTSGTTGPPKGVLMPRGAMASNLDALAEAWSWTADDVVAQALPLFHGYGLLVGMIGPLRRGGGLVHLGRFSPETLAGAVHDGATMLFAVPTMYRRLADAAEGDPQVAAALGSARILACGAAGLPQVEHERIARLAPGARVLERYGMTETLMSTAVRADGTHRPGFAGPPLPGVQLRLVDEEGAVLDVADEETIGEIHVRGPNLFLGYLNQEEATRAAFDDEGWFRTGDLAVRAPDGQIRIVGRRATDLIKSGGYKIGAGEVESALLEHPAVEEAAVTAEPDPDLGERIVAWVVLRVGAAVGADELAAHVGGLLAPHKRPRRVVFLDALPRTPMGKVRKRELREPG